ncbi:hypothetical protein V8E51_002763 [Hyaloscypha variabilis]
MAIVNPEERASAAQMIVKCFDVVGLSTPRNQVPALTTSPSPVIAAARAPAPAPPAFTTQPTQTKPRGFQMNANIFAGPAPKARDPLQHQPFSPTTRDPPKTTGSALKYGQ